MNGFIQKAKDFYQKHKISLAISLGSVGGLLLSAPANAAGLDDMTSAATAQFLATTGFSYSELVTKTGTWIKMFLGGGLGLVDALIGWIIALIIFGVIVALLFRAMRFLHILR